MEENGYTFKIENTENLGALKSEHNIPYQLQSCHTAIVDGYIIEGHVPVAEFEKLLAEKPDIAGIGVGGMPFGSPGMELPDGTTEPFDVMAFDDSGNMWVFASYR